MESWWQWYSDKKEEAVNWCYKKYEDVTNHPNVKAISDVATESYKQVKTLAVKAWQYRSYLANTIDFPQFWEGWSRVTQPNIPAVVSSAKTCAVIAKTVTANLLFYAGTQFIYEATINPAIEETPLERSMKIIAAWYCWRLSCRMFLSENPIYNVVLAKAADEHTNKELFPACPCGENSLDVIKANLAAGFYYFSHIKAAQLLGTIIPFSEPFFLAQAYGESFLEYKLMRMCTIHRYETLAKNNSYAFGLGLSFMVVTKACQLLAYYGMTKLREAIYDDAGEMDNTYINDGIAALVLQYFIIVAIMIDKPFPGKQRGLDIFYHARMVMESLLKQGGNLIVSMLKKPGEKINYSAILDSINAFPLTKYVKYFFASSDYHSLESYVKTPEVQLFLDIKGDDIQNVLDWFINVRKQPNTKRFAYVAPYIPDFLLAKEIKEIVKILVEKKLDGVLEEANDFITTARLKIRLYDAKTLKEIAYGNILDLPPVLALPPANTKPIESPEQKPKEEPAVTAMVVAKNKVDLLYDYQPKAEAMLEPSLPKVNSWVLIENYSPAHSQATLFHHKKNKKYKNRVEEIKDDILDDWQDIKTNRNGRLANLNA